MYYECFCSESFLIYSMMRFEANNIRKGKIEVVNLVHSYGRWEIKPREVKQLFHRHKRCHVKATTSPRNHFLLVQTLLFLQLF